MAWVTELPVIILSLNSDELSILVLNLFMCEMRLADEVSHKKKGIGVTEFVRRVEVKSRVHVDAQLYQASTLGTAEQD